MMNVVSKSILTALLVVGAQPAASKVAHAHHVTKTVVNYIGAVDAKTAERFVNVVSGNVDKVIGLKVSVERGSTSNNRYNADMSGNRLVVSSGDPMDSSIELVVDGPIGRTWNEYTIDGFYLIKSGGMHAAGAISIAVTPVDEAKIRLNPAVRVVTKPF